MAAAADWPLTASSSSTNGCYLHLNRLSFISAMKTTCSVFCCCCCCCCFYFFKVKWAEKDELLLLLPLPRMKCCYCTAARQCFISSSGPIGRCFGHHHSSFTPFVVSLSLFLVLHLSSRTDLRLLLLLPMCSSKHKTVEMSY